MSDLEFQRELSPEQIREALSLLDNTAGTQNQNLRIEDLRPAEEVSPESDHSSTTMAPQDRPPAAEDPQQRKKHLNLAVAFFGIAIAAAGALALLSLSESPLSPPIPGIAHEQAPEQSAAAPAKSAPSPLPVAKPPPDQSPGGSEGGTGQGFYYNAGRAIGSIFLTANWVCDGDNAAYPTVVRASDASPPPAKTGCASTPTGAISASNAALPGTLGLCWGSDHKAARRHDRGYRLLGAHGIYGRGRVRDRALASSGSLGCPPQGDARQEE
jgi:hypothetical protein